MSCVRARRDSMRRRAAHGAASRRRAVLAQLLEVGLRRQPRVLAEAAVEGRQRVEAGGEGHLVDARRGRPLLQLRQQMLQACLVDVLVEALAEHLVEQVGDLVARVAGGGGDLMQVQRRVEVGLAALEIVLQVPRQQAQLAGREAQAAGGGTLHAVAGLGLGLDQQGVFVDPPDQAVTHGNGLAGTKGTAVAQAQAVLDERGIAVDTDAVAVHQELVRPAGHGGAYIVAELRQVQAAVLEVVVVFHVGVVERQHRVDVAVLPAEVVTHHRFAGGGSFVIVLGHGRSGIGKWLRMPKRWPRG